MWFTTIILNLLHLVSPYNRVRSDSAIVSSCSTLINSCNRDIAGKCDRLYHTYYLDCADELDNTHSNTCSKKCKRAFKALLKHPTFSRERFQNCDCQGESANFCVKQKCKLITSCLGGECRDQITATTPSQNPSVVSTFSSTPSETSITMSTSTVPLDKVNCETVIAHCDKKNDCSLLLKSRDRSCSGFTVQNQHCTQECAQANQLLRDNFVGQHMTTCKFETPSHETTKFTSLIKTCIPRDTPTQSPTYRTEHPSRPVGDCKRQFLECNNDEECHRKYNRVMKECKRKNSNKFEISTCNPKCVEALQDFRILAQGSALWSCSCTGQLASRRCDIIKHTFSDICSSEPCVDFLPPDECETCVRTNNCNSDCGLLCKKSCERCPESEIVESTTGGPSIKPLSLSTQDETLASATSQPTPSVSELSLMPTIRTQPRNKIMKFYKVNVTCEDYMNVRIDYSAEIDYSPHFTAEDKSCKMAASPPGSRTATLRLKYNPPDCGTRIVKPHASDTHYRVMRNRIYVRSVAGSDSYDPIQEIECRVPYNKPDQENWVETQNIKMSFYSDSEFSRGFGTNTNEIDNELLQLGDNKTVFVEVKSTDNRSFILETCFATPNGNEEYPQRYYFIENGCKKDDSFNMIDFIPGNKTRFSFYRIMFSESKYSGRVYVHCNIRFCDKTHPDCRVNNCRDNEMDMFEKLSVSQGPYTYAVSNALSRVTRTTHSFLLLSLSTLLILSLR